MNLFAFAGELTAENRPFALLHIVECRGSSPRHAATMLVTEEGDTAGTIGGGMMERLAIEEARTALQEGRSRLFHGTLSRKGPDAVGADCGGAMTIFIAVYPRRPSLVLFGAGHVNRALAQAAAPLGFPILVADPWAENLRHPALPENCTRVTGKNYSDILTKLTLNRDSFVVIATNHEDYEVLKQVTGLPLGYLGLLASRRKAQHFRQTLLKTQEASEAQLQQLHAPVGLDIGAETPEEIAISILGELIRHYRQANKDAAPEAQTPRLQSVTAE